MQDAPGNVYTKQYDIILSNNSINIPLNNLTYISENTFNTYDKGINDSRVWIRQNTFIKNTCESLSQRIVLRSIIIWRFMNEHKNLRKRNLKTMIKHLPVYPQSSELFRAGELSKKRIRF